MSTAIAEPIVREETQESSARAVWRLAWPAVALNSLQVVNSLLDRGFIGHLQPAALTAHGGSINVMFLSFSLAMALATGATALVSRAFGAEERAQYRMASRQSLSLAVVLGFVMAIGSFVVSPYVAQLILPAKDREAIVLMGRFLQWFSAGLPAMFIIQALAGCLRGVGDTKSPMVLSGLQILLHMLLNYLFIFQVGMGLVGAAAALTASAWVAAVGYVLYVGNTAIGPQWRIRLPRRDWAIRILRIATPAAGMAIMRVFSLIVFMLALKLLPNGSAAIAGASLAFAIESIMFMPSFGLSSAAGALVGQSLGAKDPDRAERLGWTAAHHAALVTLALVTPIFLSAHWIASFLAPGKPDISREAASLLRYLCVTEVFFAYAMVTMGAMQGAGETKRPFWITIFALWGLRVPLAFLCALPSGQALVGGLVLPFGLALGASGAWLSMAITQAVQGVLSVLAFKQGQWKLKEV